MPSHAAVDTQAQQIRQGHVTPVVLRNATRWRTVNYSFISLGIKITHAITVDAGIRIIPKTEDDYRKIVRLFKEENIPQDTFPLPSERNVAVIRGSQYQLPSKKSKSSSKRRVMLSNT
nr:unnamed protein product [Callosobruchus chinensis]